MSSPTSAGEAAVLEGAQSGQQAKEARPDAPIERLPAQLFVDILALLQMHELSQAARVCKSWSEIVSTPPLWSHLSFILSDEDLTEDRYSFTSTPSRTEVPWQKIIGRAKGGIVSIEMSHISHDNIPKLSKLLLKEGAPALKHITWTHLRYRAGVEPTIMMEAVQNVLELAQSCPQLVTLEAFGPSDGLAPELFWSGHLQTAKLERFATNVVQSMEVYDHLSSMLSHSKVVRLHATGWHSRTYLRQSWLLGFLSNNASLEEFLGDLFVEQGSWHADGERQTEPEEDDSIATSLSLKRLSLRPWSPPVGRQVKFHAPNLRELVTEVQLLHKFSQETSSNLSTLRLSVDQPDDDNVKALQRLSSHLGLLTLRFDCFYTVQVPPILELLASGFIWPGLERITLCVGSGESAFNEELPRLVAARSAGALGASKEQYEAIAQGLGLALDQGSSPASSASSLPPRASQLANMTFAGPPLCKAVHWRINDYDRLPPETVEWLEEYDNVHLFDSAWDDSQPSSPESSEFSE